MPTPLYTLRILLALLTVSQTVFAVSEALEPKPHYARIARLFARDISREHLSGRDMDDSVAAMAFTNLLKSLDYDRVYFLASDIEEFKEDEAYLDDRLRQGNVEFAYRVMERFKERVRDRVAYVETLLEDGFDLDIDESYRWKRKDAPRCLEHEEWNDLWRKRVKNEFIKYRVSNALRDVEAQSQTNSLPDTPLQEAVETTDASTNSPAALPDDEEPPIPEKTPKELIIDAYRQFQSLIEDNDSEWVLQKYLSAFARAYDPHCDYMSQTSVEDFEIEMKLSLVGIGALLRPEDGAAKIVRLIPGGPAASDTRDVRLRPGDKIIAVAQGDEEPVSIIHWPLYRSVRLIRGEKDSTVVLTVIPSSGTGGTTKQVDLVRDEVKLEAREAKSEIREIPGTDETPQRFGVIRLPAFYADMKGKHRNKDYKSSSRDVAKILRTMREEHVCGVVLDLRSNGGGSLLEAVQMTGLFIESGPTVQVRERFRKSILPDNDPSIVYPGPLVVLVNRLSASASEILAGALQDYGRAIVIGDSQTHGKGSVQTILPISRDDKMGSIKVTSALFYRVSGASTQLRGVIPDIVIPSAFEYMDLGEDALPNPLPWSRVREVIYSPFGDLSETIPAITQRSMLRRDTDPRFDAYRQLLGRVETLQDSEKLSLNIEKRREQAIAEKELFDIQNRLIEQASGESDDDTTQDIVLGECINILADLATEQDYNPTLYAGSAPSPRKTALEAFGDWFKADSDKEP